MCEQEPDPKTELAEIAAAVGRVQGTLDGLRGRLERVARRLPNAPPSPDRLRMARPMTRSVD